MSERWFLRCPECDGSGEPYDGVKCAECEGFGTAETEVEPVTLADLEIADGNADNA